MLFGPQTKFDEEPYSFHDVVKRVGFLASSQPSEFSADGRIVAELMADAMEQRRLGNVPHVAGSFDCTCSAHFAACPYNETIVTAVKFCNICGLLRH
jgi:hypothetical protein